METYIQTDRAIQIDLGLADRDSMLIRGFDGTEAVSKLYEYHLDLAFQGSAMRFDEVMGKKASISLELAAGVTRQFNGIITQLSRGTRDEKFTYFRAILRPTVWRLTKSWDCRIYQDKTVVDILQNVFAGFYVDYSRLQLDEFVPHNYRVQYRESSFNFASRLMEEAGICYFFDHSERQEKLILMNARTSTAHPSLLVDDSLNYLEDRANTVVGPHIRSWEKVQELASGVERCRDHHFQMPYDLTAQEFIRDSIPLGTSKEDKDLKLHLANDENMEVYDYPGEYAKRFDMVDRQGNIDPDRLKVNAESSKVARLHMEQEEAGSVTLVGLSDYRHVASGYKFQLLGHFQDCDSYMVTEVEHSCSQPLVTGGTDSGTVRYSNRFTCIPGTLPYRPYDPALHHPVAATQTARVVGPWEQEIFTDCYGRVKVQFYWDRQGRQDQMSSCWLRVAQPSAGVGWGHQWVPRIGQEVIVDYLEGDIDQPIVTGSVYNRDNRPPWIGPEDNAATASQKASQSGIKTHSTPHGGPENYNELRFEDRKGHEAIHLHAERNLETSVESCESHNVGVNQTIKVGKDRDVTVLGSEKQFVMKDQQVVVVGDRDVSVCHLESKSVWDDQTLYVGGTSSTTIFEDRQLHVKGLDTSLANSRYITTKEEFVVSAGRITLQAEDEIFLKVGGNSIIITSAGVRVIGHPYIDLNPNGVSTKEYEMPPLPNDVHQ